MKVLSFPIRNQRLSLVLFAMLVALGLTSWLDIPRVEDPLLDLPTYTVVVVSPGSGPVDLERLVVRPVEDRLRGLERVETLRSRISDGLATVTVEFQSDQDPDARYDEVLREMNALRSELPSELSAFAVERSTTLDVAIAQLALVAPHSSYRELDLLAEALEDRLTAIPGVRTATRWGIPARRVEVGLHSERLQGLGLPPGEVLAAIAGESADLPAGSVEMGPRRFTVRGSGSYESPEQVAATVVRGGNGALLTVGDVASVRWSHADSTHRTRYNGERAVFLTLTQQEGENVARVRERVWAALDEFEALMPPGVRLERGFDQAANVSRRLGSLGRDFLTALALVSVTLLPLGLRAGGIVMVSIPLSLALGLTLLNWAGFSVNQLSIVGAVLALGLVVDDSIVVVENISRFLRAGRSRVEAAVEGTRQIAAAAAGSTAILVFAFLPLLFLPGASGQYIRSLPLTVVLTVVSSLFVALLVIPWLASLFLPASVPAEGNRALRAFDRGIRAGFAPALERALRHPRKTMMAMGVVAVGSLGLLPVVGFSLFPPAETPQFYVNVTAPEGAGLHATGEAARFAESVLLARPEVRGVFTSVGRDNPQVYYNVIPRRENPSVGQLFVVLDRFDAASTPLLLDELRGELGEYPGARLELREFENGPPIDAPIALRVMGPDLDTLRHLAGEVEGILQATPGTRYVNNPIRLQRTDLRVEIDRGRAGLNGVTHAAVDQALRLGLEGIPAGVVREGNGEAREVVVKTAGASPPSPGTLERLPVPSGTGTLIPLGAIATVRFEAGVPEIERVDRERGVTVTSFVETGELTDRLTRRALEGVGRMELPPGYRIVAAGEEESRRESFGGIATAVVIASFMMLAILILEFGTFRSTLIVAAEIPLGVMGGILALWLTGNSLSFTAMIGFVALLGIEIKTSILLVDFTNRLRREGKGLRESILEAGEVRFLPILLTTMTAVGGLLPLALKGEALYAPLAWVIIGGLLTSTFLGRILTPVVYSLIPPDLPSNSGAARRSEAAVSGVPA